MKNLYLTMKKYIPILFAGLALSCANSNKSGQTTNLKQAPTATVIGKRIEGGASSSAYIYNHATNSDVIYFGYEYSKEQLDSVYGECTRFLEDADPCYGGAAYWYEEKGVLLNFEYGNFNGPNEKWVCAVDMTEGYYTLHISDSLEVKVGDNINDLNLSHHKYVQEIKRLQRNDTIRLHHRVFPYCDCPPFFVLEYKNDTITYIRYDDICT